MDNKDNLDNFISYLEKHGALSWTGMDSRGDQVFHINTEKMKELAPELYEAYIKEIDDSLLSLFKKGLVEVEYDTNLEPKFKITPEIYEEIQNEILRQNNNDQ